MADKKERKVCPRCGKDLDIIKNFYLTRDKERRVDLCKKCLTAHVDPFDYRTLLEPMQKLDYPVIPSEWNSLVRKAKERNPDKLNATAIFGRYVGKMKLKQWDKYSWEDTESFLADYEENQKALDEKRDAIESQLKDQLEQGKISESEYTMLLDAAMDKENKYEDLKKPAINAYGTFFNENDFMSETELPDPTESLTQDDKIYLAMKWGRLYKPSEWIELEKKYDEMSSSFDIQDSDTIGTLILICKTYLKMNRAIDEGDLGGYQQLSRVYDSLRKSAKFTAVQNKERTDGAFDSIGEIVELCEREGFIPRYCTDIPQDKIDFTLKDMNNYLRTLVKEDLGFGQQIEDAMRAIKVQAEMQDEEITDEISMEDYENYYADKYEQRIQDEELLEGE